MSASLHLHVRLSVNAWFGKIEVKILLRDISVPSASTIGDALLYRIPVISIGIVEYRM